MSANISTPGGAKRSGAVLLPFMKRLDHRVGLGPLVFDSPHSGTAYPDDFLHSCERHALRRAEDTHVEQIFDFAAQLDATLIAARFPRSYIDVNRAPDDIDVALLAEPWPEPVAPSAKVKLGKGLVWRTLDDGTPIYDHLLAVADVQQRIHTCWRPYHQAVKGAIADAVHRHGRAIHINCHSMPSVADAFSTDFPGQTHADFVLGDRDHTTAARELTQWLADYLRQRGHSVSINHPYKGVELVRAHGKPSAGVHSVQFEINKRLYMDEQSLELHGGYPPLKAMLHDMFAALVQEPSWAPARHTQRPAIL
jgi:N-formylglutamate deformylase